jgi:hypothetical protein
MSMGIIQPDHRAPLPGVPRLAGEPPAAVRPAREIAGA